MKNKHILSIFLLGILIVFLGSMLKINHVLLMDMNAGNICLITGMSLQALSGVLVIWKILTNKKMSDFWNS